MFSLTFFSLFHEELAVKQMGSRSSVANKQGIWHVMADLKYETVYHNMPSRSGNSVAAPGVGLGLDLAPCHSSSPRNVTVLFNLCCTCMTTHHATTTESRVLES